MPNKVYKSSHWRIECKTAKLNNTDILDQYDLDQAKKQLFEELNILLEDSVLPDFGRVIITDAKPRLIE